jgi:hypothetical protein
MQIVQNLNDTKNNKYNNRDLPQKPLHSPLVHKRVKIQMHNTRILFALHGRETGLGDRLWAKAKPTRAKAVAWEIPAVFPSGLQPPEVIYSRVAKPVVGRSSGGLTVMTEAL